MRMKAKKLENILPKSQQDEKVLIITKNNCLMLFIKYILQTFHEVCNYLVS